MKQPIITLFILLLAVTNIVAQEYSTVYIVKDKKDAMAESITHSHNINVNGIDLFEILPNSYLKILVPQGKTFIKCAYKQDVYDKETQNYLSTKDKMTTLFLQTKSEEEYYVHLNTTIFGSKLKLVETPKDLQKLMNKKDNAVCLAAYNLSESETKTLAEGNPAKVISLAQEDEKISGVDKNIPISETTNDKTFAVIIANENYQEVAKVPFAIHDGEIFAKYCKNTLGIPSDNIHLVKDATYNNFRRQLDWVLNVIQAYGDKASILFYYAGHGIPDDGGESAYLLPVDGFGNDINSGYGLNELYTKFGQSEAKRVTIFLDACFSGAKRDGDMLVAARGVAREVKRASPYGKNMVVFSAAQGSETAYPEKEEGHGMFTYFLLKKLQESSGNVTYGELADYIVRSVSQRSIVVNGKSQTPDVNFSPALGESWKQWKMK